MTFEICILQLIIENDSSKKYPSHYFKLEEQFEYIFTYGGSFKNLDTQIARKKLKFFLLFYRKRYTFKEIGFVAHVLKKKKIISLNLKVKRTKVQ